MNIYTDGTYSKSNPSWHVEDAPWKACQVLALLARERLNVRTVIDIGCGTGDVLAQIAIKLPGLLSLKGYEVNQCVINQDIRTNDPRISFSHIQSFGVGSEADLLVCMDVVEHVPDYLGFLAQCKKAAKFKIYHIPLDVHASSVIRGSCVLRTEEVGHLHYFTAESALRSLERSGHIIKSVCYTFKRTFPSLKSGPVPIAAHTVRFLGCFLSKKHVARWLGGLSLLVLCE